jgi:BMFP domain-containing protein YqiC
MNTESNDQVRTATRYAASKLRRDLHKVIAEAQSALERMDAGQRPSYSMSGSIFGQTATDVEASAQRLAALLELGLLSQDDALAAVTNTNLY